MGRVGFNHSGGISQMWFEPPGHIGEQQPSTCRRRSSVARLSLDLDADLALLVDHLERTQFPFQIETGSLDQGLHVGRGSRHHVLELHLDELFDARG